MSTAQSVLLWTQSALGLDSLLLALFLPKVKADGAVRNPRTVYLLCLVPWLFLLVLCVYFRTLFDAW
ncbi:hypothetical protein [Streptomyces sp. NPDC092952]|uniref:hypothetical protein n=1 Tax=Streptomyces sp. NPDC092952 TaxID=3366018 RepID=UPI0038072FAA